MRKIFISGAVLVVFVATLFVFNSQTSQAPAEIVSPSPQAKSSPVSSPVKAEPKNYQITVTETGFLPQELTVKVGDTVTFVNKGSSLIWPAAGPHPTHAICPGFDSLAGVAPNGSYAHTFRQAMVCPFHDHLHAADGKYRGKITVIE